MSKPGELNTTLKIAQESENSGDYFSAVHYYKKALEISRDLGDSKNITLCKNKVIEMNQKSEESFSKFSSEQEIPIEEVNKFVNSILEGNLSTVLKRIGVHPFLYPHFNQVVESTKKTMPVSFAFASLSTISPIGHLVSGGTNANYSWLMQMYAFQQGFIKDVYLPRIFYKLTEEKAFDKENLLKYLKDSSVFQEENLLIIEVGINRYFDKDFVSALHILTPQFESVFLSLSEKLGIDIIALNRGKEISTQTKTLSAEYLSSEIFQKIWSKNFCEQLKFVLFEPLGYMLRHKIAHGQINKNECNYQTVSLVLYFFLVLAARVGVKKS